jgi:hypothetical protein
MKGEGGWRDSRASVAGVGGGQSAGSHVKSKHRWNAPHTVCGPAGGGCLAQMRTRSSTSSSDSSNTLAGDVLLLWARRADDLNKLAHHVKA